MTFCNFIQEDLESVLTFLIFLLGCLKQEFMVTKCIWTFEMFLLFRCSGRDKHDLSSSAQSSPAHSPHSEENRKS